VRALGSAYDPAALCGALWSVGDLLSVRGEHSMKLDCEMVEVVLTVPNGLGIHARTATMLVKAMQAFTCSVTLSKDGIEADAKSVLGLLLLAASPGSDILIRAQGPRSSEAVQEVVRLIHHEQSAEIP
jgi:phosphocarrier protein HPr